MKDSLVGDGVRGDSFMAGLESSLFGVLGVIKPGVLFAELCKAVISDNELRRFFLGLSVPCPSPIVLRGLEPSKANAPNTVGRSREFGRLGVCPAKVIESVEFMR
jgi:hypothetical protein